VVNSQERDASKPPCCAKAMCSSSLFCKWLEVLITIVGHIQKQHISNVLHQDNSKQQTLLHKKAQDAMDWKQKFLPVRERELTCLQSFKSKKERINFSLHGIATNKQTIKNAFNEWLITQKTLSLLFSSLLFSSLALCSSSHRNKCRDFLCHKMLRYVEPQTLTLIICLGARRRSRWWVDLKISFQKVCLLRQSFEILFPTVDFFNLTY